MFRVTQVVRHHWEWLVKCTFQQMLGRAREMFPSLWVWLVPEPSASHCQGLNRQGQHVGTWEVAAMNLVEKSATIPSTKKTGLDRAYCMHPQTPLLSPRRCLILGRLKEGELTAASGSTGTRRHLLLGTPGGMMFMSYMVRGPWAAPRRWL